MSLHKSCFLVQHTSATCTNSEKTIEKISKEYRNNKDQKVKSALDAAKLSNEALKLIQKGKMIELSYLTIVSSRLIKKIKGS